MLRFLTFPALALLGAALHASAQQAPAEPPKSAIFDFLSAALAAEDSADAKDTHYTYTVIVQSTVSDLKGHPFGSGSREYEMTWLNDIPYLRLRYKNGEPLSSHEEKKEQEIYDRYIEEHKRLGMRERVHLAHDRAIPIPAHPDAALSPGYTLQEVRTEKTPQGPLRVIEAVPEATTPPESDGCHYHFTFWIGEAPLYIRHFHADAHDDASPVCQRSREDFWYGLIDGFPKLIRSEDSFGFTQGHFKLFLEAEGSYTKYRRFRTAVTIRPGEVVPPETPSAP